jgi:mono/diheme cytochrome c family protein
MRELEAQIGKSVETTMQGGKLKIEQVNELTAYLRSLAPPPALGRVRGKRNDAVVSRGRKVFESQGCANCHTPPTYTISSRREPGRAVLS